MNFDIIEEDKIPVAVVRGNGVLVASPQDMLDLIATVRYEHNCSHIVLPKEALDPAFFDLKTGLAGEMLQKVVNYNAALAIVGDFSQTTSKALQDFIRESNRGTRIFFLPSVTEAAEILRTKAAL